MASNPDSAGLESDPSQTKVHVARVPSGTGTRKVEVVRLLDADRDPERAQLAEEGALQFFGETPLAETYLYLSEARSLAFVVVPTVLCHRWAEEWSRLLTFLGEEAPPLAAKADVVIGSAGLREAMERRRHRDAQGAERAKADDELSARNAELDARARGLDVAQEQLDAITREIRQREQDLDIRFERLRKREEARLARAGGPLEDDASDEASSEEHLEDEGAPVELTGDEAELIEDAADDDASEVEPTRVVDASMIQDGDAPIFDDEIADVDMDAVEEVVGADVISLDVVEPIDDDSLSSVLLEEPEEEEPEGAVPAPPALASDPAVQLVARMEDSRVHLYVRLKEGQTDEVFGEHSQLLVQYVAVEERPVVLLALTDFSADRPFPRRTALDPRNENDVELLESLQDGSEARVLIYSARARFRRETTIHLGERKANLAAIMDRARAAEGNLDGAMALERALAAAPPVALKGLPFEPADGANHARAAKDAVETLLPWSSAEKRDMALLALSVPHERIESTFHRVLSDALRFGIAVPLDLVARAVDLDIAPDPSAFVLEAIDNFRAASSGPSLSVAAIGENWEALLALAAELELAVATSAHDQAQRAIAKARGESVRPPPADADLDGLDDDGLMRASAHPRTRLNAALKLLERGGRENFKGVAATLRNMPREEVLTLVPAMVRVGEGACDALIDGLGAKKSFVRHACALGLGELQLRRSIGPLLQLLRSEESDVWEEVAWCVGQFGPSAMRSLERLAKNPRGADGRVHRALAHVEADAPGTLDALGGDDDRLKAAAIGARADAKPAARYAEVRLSETATGAIPIFARALTHRLRAE